MKSKMLIFLVVGVFSVIGNTGDLGSSIFAALMAQMASNGNVSVSVSSGDDDCHHHQYHQYHHHQCHSQLSSEAAEYGLEGIVSPVYYKGQEIGRSWVSGPRAALHDLAGVVYVPGRYNRNIHFLIPVDSQGKRIEVVQVLGTEED